VCVLHCRRPRVGEKQFAYDELRRQAKEAGIPFVSLWAGSAQELRLSLLPVFRYGSPTSWAAMLTGFTGCDEPTACMGAKDAACGYLAFEGALYLPSCLQPPQRKVKEVRVPCETCSAQLA
jgi:hypothetical protein